MGLCAQRVLEVAYGTGFWTQHIAPAARRLTATDGTAEPLEFARLRPGADEVSFLQADAYNLPTHLGSFNGAFAGLWFSHVPIGARDAFLASLHARLLPGARVVLIDNGPAQLRDFPIAQTDAQGNTYQMRTLRDGTIHKVLKNFPSQIELEKLLAPHARVVEHRELDNFWLCEYELHQS